MSEIYIPFPQEGFELCHPKRQEDFEAINLFINGKSRLKDWSPIDVNLIKEDNGIQLRPSSSPWLGSHALVFKKEVVEKLGALLENFGEFLELDCDETPLVVYNSTKVVDALDENSSSLSRFSGGRIMRIEKYAFYPEVIDKLLAFKIPNLRVSPTYLGKNVVDAWRSLGFSGLDFKRIF